jgi:integrase
LTRLVPLLVTTFGRAPLWSDGRRRLPHPACPSRDVLALTGGAAVVQRRLVVVVEAAVLGRHRGPTGRQARAGVRRQRFHDMRHAFATLLLDAGEEIAVISKMLGHADYSTTVDVYSHLSRERSRVAAARIDSLLKRREAPAEAAV